MIEIIESFTSLEHPAKQGEFSAFYDAYVECLLWFSVVDYVEERYAEEYETAQETKEKIAKDCIDFVKVAGGDIQKAVDNNSGYSWAMAGHDFALTRNGHGAGYWDRGLGELGDRLTKLAESKGTVGVYLADDGKVYQM